MQVHLPLLGAMWDEVVPELPEMNALGRSWCPSAWSSGCPGWLELGRGYGRAWAGLGWGNRAGLVLAANAAPRVLVLPQPWLKQLNAQAGLQTLHHHRTRSGFLLFCGLGGELLQRY